MELKAHFSNIHTVVIDQLGQAKSEIVAAIAWFTDREIFEVLCKKAKSGIKVSVALMGDEINQGPGRLNFQRLRNFGGQIMLLPPDSRDAPTMHHKFCVIDGSTVITGSYNWSQKARSSDENITVATDAADFAVKYLDTFEGLLVRTGHDTPVFAPVAAQDDAARGELVTAGFADIARLRFLLESLELRHESLNDKNAELERQLMAFNRRHDDALGSLIQRVLKARAELARLVAADNQHNNYHDKEREEAEAAARDAEDNYRDYTQQHEELQRLEPVPKLADEDEKEMKALYRKACGLCHPDKFPEDSKEAAHRAFVDLQDAYKANNLAGVREIHATVLAGGLTGVRSKTLSDVDALKAAIAELEYAITRLVAGLKVLQDSEGAKLVGAAGANEAEWQRFFEQRGDALEQELARITSDILAAQTEEAAFP